MLILKKNITVHLMNCLTANKLSSIPIISCIPLEKNVLLGIK